jgi:hypothetical protein
MKKNAKKVEEKKKVVNKVTAPKYELVSFEVTAVIPTQSFGNITPKITVKTKTIEEAKAIVMPMIEEMYATYAEAPRDGSRVPVFISKSKVTVKEKIVETKPVVTGTKDVVKLTPPTATKEDVTPVSEPFMKAINAIKGAMSVEATEIIEDQIQKSTRLTKEEKPVLLTEILLKRKELNK